MSSSTIPLVAPQPSSTDVPAAAATSSNTSGSSTPPGSELYLFTFLTTLLLLLGVSVAIIIRSLILRRRFRRRVQEAIANGTLIPGLMTEPSRRDIGEKPKMWDVWIGTPEVALKNSEITGEEESDMPVPSGLGSVLPIAATKAASSDLSSAAIRARAQSGLMPSHLGLYVSQSPPLFHRFWPRRPRTPEAPTPSNLEAQTHQTPGTTSTPSTSNPAPGLTVANAPSITSVSASTAPAPLPVNTVQVSLLIAMPSAAQSRYEAYVAQSNASKGAISLPLPSLHPLEGHKSMISSTETDVESTQNQTEITEVEGEDKSDSQSRMNDEKHLSYSGSHRHQQHRLSESSIAKGKMPEFTLPHPHLHVHNKSTWGYLEEGEIPYMEFGVLEVVMDGSVSAVDDGKEPSMTSSSGSSSRS